MFSLKIFFEIFKGEFAWWSRSVIGNILGAFFYGYLGMMMVGGWAGDRFGHKRALVCSLAGMSVVTVISPSAARFGQ